MNAHKLVMRETLLVAAGEFIVALLTVLVYVLIEKFSLGVCLGALAGAILAVLNYYLMALTLGRISDSAVSTGEVRSAQAKARVSYTIRLVVMFVILAVLASTKLIEPIPAIVPLALMQPIIIVTQRISQRW